LDFIAYAIENKNEVKRMKKMKRILSLVLVLVMAAALPPAAWKHVRRGLQHTGATGRQPGERRRV
jgi:hypothetical protein